MTKHKKLKIGKEIYFGRARFWRRQNSNFPLVPLICGIIAEPFCTFLCCQSNSEAFAERTESKQHTGGGGGAGGGGGGGVGRFNIIDFYTTTPLTKPDVFPLPGHHDVELRHAAEQAGLKTGFMVLYRFYGGL